MTEAIHPPLNRISATSKCAAVAYSFAQHVHFVFEVRGPVSPNRPAEFICRVYDSTQLDHAVNIRTETVPTDGCIGLRNSANGRTLEELVHNLDWAHKPSELALLKSILATRVTSNDGQLVGDLVLLQLSAEEISERSQRQSNIAQFLITSQAQYLSEQATALIDQATAEATHAAQFGLLVEVKPDLSKVKQTP